MIDLTILFEEIIKRDVCLWDVHNIYLFIILAVTKNLPELTLADGHA